MPAIVRQQYLDPQDGEYRTREIILDVEIVRPDEASDSSSTLQLRADPVIAHHQSHLPNFAPIAISPLEALGVLLDGKRTSNPPRCWRTRLSEPSSNLTFVVDGVKLLHLSVGDPVVVLESLDNHSKRMFGIVKEIDGDAITLYDNDQKQQSFYKGALVQNLANRWVPDYQIEGAKTQLKRPTLPTFRAKRTNQAVEVMFSVPLVRGVTKFYDVYVRNHSFDKIEPHWIPDLVDIPLETDRVTIETYNGGPEAGGGTFADKQPNKLVCVVIAKAGSGFVDVNESGCVPQTL
jgi:hypothetical protein